MFFKSTFPLFICADSLIAITLSEKANVLGFPFTANSFLDDSNAPFFPTKSLYNPEISPHSSVWDLKVAGVCQDHEEKENK